MIPKTIKTLVFDCDGVLLNSNAVKTRAFYQAALPYGVDAARALVEWHVANGGISRHVKFRYFLDEIASDLSGPNLKELLAAFAAEVRVGLMSSEVAQGLVGLRKRTASMRWLVVSGGDQSELRNVFSERGLATFFDGGIFGSPHTKETILAREIASGNIERPALFLGDSSYDHRAAKAAGLSFVFVSGWSELPDWRGYVRENELLSIPFLADLAR